MKIEWEHLFETRELTRGVKRFVLGTSLVKAFPKVRGNAKVQRCRLKAVGVKNARDRARKALSRRGL